MGAIRRFFLRPFASRKVDESVIVEFKGLFESALERRGLKKHLSDRLLTRLVEEAYHRAAVRESDGIPRYGHYFDQMDEIVEKVAVSMAGKAGADPIIDRILDHHGPEHAS